MEHINPPSVNTPFYYVDKLVQPENGSGVKCCLDCQCENRKEYYADMIL